MGGGRDRTSLKDYSLSVADFPHCFEETFDRWVPPPDTTREKRSRPPATMAEWARNATAQIKAFSLVAGHEHSQERLEARDELLEMHERFPHRYPCEWVWNVWKSCGGDGVQN